MPVARSWLCLLVRAAVACLLLATPTDQRADDDVRVLRKALGYAVSVGSLKLLDLAGFSDKPHAHNGPGAMLAFSAATPPAVKSLRHRRTVSSRTPNASAILRLVQPASVKSTARARSASPRSREAASANRPARCSSLAITGDFPAIPHTIQIDGGSESGTRSR